MPATTSSSWHHKTRQEHPQTHLSEYRPAGRTPRWVLLADHSPDDITAVCHHEMASLNVLVVDDHPGSRWVAEDILIRYCHAVTSCEIGAVALVLCHEQGRRFDVILLNAEMPLMNGVETARRLRAHEATKDVPIVGVSALDAIPGFVPGRVIDTIYHTFG